MAYREERGLALLQEGTADTYRLPLNPKLNVGQWLLSSHDHNHAVFGTGWGERAKNKQMLVSIMSMVTQTAKCLF